MAKVCLLAYLFFIDQKRHTFVIVHYNNFPYLGVYHDTFPNLKEPRTLSQNCKKKPATNFGYKRLGKI